MDPDPPESASTPAELMVLAEALGELRDVLLLVSLALKDYAAEAPSPAREAVLSEVELYLRQFQKPK